jgi:hypothetical protein
VKKDTSLGNVYSGKVQGRSGSVEGTSGRDVFFVRELESGIFKLHDLRTREVGTKLDMPHGKNRRSILVSKKFIDSLAT